MANIHYLMRARASTVCVCVALLCNDNTLNVPLLQWKIKNPPNLLQNKTQRTPTLPPTGVVYCFSQTALVYVSVFIYFFLGGGHFKRVGFKNLVCTLIIIKYISSLISLMFLRVTV